MSGEEIQDLKRQIEQLRETLKELSQDYQFTDPEVLGASRILDVLLVEYQKLLMKKR